MGYLVRKVRKGIPYLYEQETYREGGKVRTKNRYLGRFIDHPEGEAIQAAGSEEPDRRSGKRCRRGVRTQAGNPKATRWS